MKNLHLYQTYCLRITAALGAAVAVAVFLYGTFLLLAVSHAAQISSHEATARTLASHVSALESKYLTESAALTPAVATAQGYVVPKEVSVVYATPATLTVNR